MLITLLRSRAFALGVHLALWVLLALVFVNLRGTLPRFEQAAASTATAASPVPIAKITNLFAAPLRADLGSPTNGRNAFFTRHFIPPVVPPPPPPTTQQVPVTYRGCFQTGADPPRAFLTVGPKTVTGPVGALAAATWFIADLSPQAVVLTNTTAQTNTIPLNKTLTLQVPVP